MTLPKVATGRMQRSLGADTPAIGGDTANGGFVGGLSAEDGVNKTGVIEFVQASGGGTFTGILPDPADTTVAWTEKLANNGAVALTVYGTRIGSGESASYIWIPGSGWRFL
jgi:hypothetical protein